MRVLVLRAAAEAGRTAAKLEALGHAAICGPVTAIESTAVILPAGRFDAVLATSAHAFGSGSLDGLHRLPLFAVGQATAAAARAAGFKDTRVSLGDAAALATLAKLTLPRPAKLLFLAGRDRKPVLEEVLVQAGYDIAVVETYAARAQESWPAPVLHALADHCLAAALHFSRRSAALALALAARHDLTAAFLALDHVCLSADVAAPLREAGAGRILLASEPDETALLTLLGEAGHNAAR